MIEIVQAGQSGKTRLLIEMHRLRAKIFGRMMNWDVDVDSQGMEIDDFDVPEAVYLLALDSERQVKGSWRLLPTTQSTMIGSVWPSFLETIDMPSSPHIWEASRFGVDVTRNDHEKSITQTSHLVAEMFCGLTELFLELEIRKVYTLYDDRIARMLRRLDCKPSYLSEKRMIDNRSCQVGCFDISAKMLTSIRAASGIEHSLIDFSDLPPALVGYLEKKSQDAVETKEVSYA